MHPNVPDDVRWLVHECVPSMEHVEVLLLLARDEERAWSVDEIRQKVTVAADALPAVVARLEDAGLIVARTDDPAAPGTRYAFRPKGVKERSAVASLMRMYDMRPVSLIRFVYERPADTARLFADAFKLRKPT